MANPGSGIILAYAAFLFVLGFLGFAMANFQSKAKSAVIVGSATALLQLIAHYLYTSTKNPWHGLTVAKAFMVVNTVLFAWRGYMAWPVPEKRHVANLVAVMALGSVLAFAALHTAAGRPTRQEQQAAKAK